MRHRPEVAPLIRCDERGAVLIIVVVVTVVLTLLGLGALSLGAMESAAAVEALHARQAAFAAEATVRAVKHWFDAPAGSAGAWMVPTAADVDRSLRRLDPEGDGSFSPRSSLPSPWNSLYRQDRGDLFERPYRGGPSIELAGDAAGPDVSISADGASGAERAFLRALARGLFGEGPSPPLVLEIERISVFGPPTIGTGAARRRVGIASIEATVRLVRRSGDDAAVLARARAAGVLQDIPYAAAGPLLAGEVADGSGLDARWGSCLVAGSARLGSEPAEFYGGGWPWRSARRRLVTDADADGTLDDTDADGSADLAEWLALPGDGLTDPWFRLLAAGILAGAPSSDPQPYPFDPALIPGPWRAEDDRSGLLQSTPWPPAPFMSAGDASAAALFREAALDGGGAAHLLRYVPGTDPPLFREGTGPAETFEAATRGREGLFYFDTADGLEPRDRDGDATPDNLTPPIAVADPDWSARGVLYVNARAFTIGPSSRASIGAVEPPGEPFDDADGDGTCDEGETFLRLGYPADALAAGAVFERLGATCPALGGAPRAAGPEKNAPVTFAGLLIVTGDWAGESTARIHGALAVLGSVTAPSSTGARALQLLYDHRLGEDAWPPPGSILPRTVWQGRSVSP